MCCGCRSGMEALSRYRNHAPLLPVGCSVASFSRREEHEVIDVHPQHQFPLLVHPFDGSDGAAEQTFQPAESAPHLPRLAVHPTPRPLRPLPLRLRPAEPAEHLLAVLRRRMLAGAPHPVRADVQSDRPFRPPPLNRAAAGADCVVPADPGAGCTFSATSARSTAAARRGRRPSPAGPPPGRTSSSGGWWFS